MILPEYEISEREAPGNRLRHGKEVELIVPYLPAISTSPAERGTCCLEGTHVVFACLDLCEAGPPGHSDRNLALVVLGAIA
jgi:hypothetical protein